MKYGESKKVRRYVLTQYLELSLVPAAAAFLTFFIVGDRNSIPLAFAEPAVQRSSGSWGARGAYAGPRLSGKEASVRGNVLSSQEFSPGAGQEPGLELKLATAEGDLLVHVGPRWLILENDLNFTRGEPLTVIGIKINFDRKPVLVADEIIKGNQKINLRELATPNKSPR